MKSLVLLIFLLFITFESRAYVRALNTAATGMAAQETNVNTISNNIANVNTIGYKKSRTEFQDLLYETQVQAGSRSSGTSQYQVGIQTGSGARVSAVKKNFAQGQPQITKSPFDLLVQGEGFFAVVLPNNEVRYTRDGSFTTDQQGNLVTKNGYRLFPGITVPPGVRSVNISATGDVDAYFQNQVEPTRVGAIPLFTFTNAVGLKSMGSNLYQITEASGAPIQNVAGQNNSGTIMQGALESSNVSIMTEMTELIKAQRAYEMNSKVMGIADQMMQTVNNIR